MINYLSDKETSKLQVRGGLSEISSDCIYLVHLVYEHMPEEVAEEFKYGMTEAFKLGLPFMSKAQLAKKVVETAKEMAEQKKEDSEDKTDGVDDEVAKILVEGIKRVTAMLKSDKDKEEE